MGHVNVFSNVYNKIKVLFHIVSVAFHLQCFIKSLHVYFHKVILTVTWKIYVELHSCVRERFCVLFICQAEPNAFAADSSNSFNP